MATSTLIVLVITSSAVSQANGGRIKQEEVDYQSQAFQQWWETELEWNFDKLPVKGQVPSSRVPYSGHIYPDRGGGTIHAMRKYDRAFHRGRSLATNYERRDTSIFTETVYVRAGLFGLRRRAIEQTPHWHGHCNGWTAAAIRHAEPRRSVRRNGVTFTPSDIKGLLAEIYIYADTEFLGGIDRVINPGTFHVVLTNWLGRGSYPIGMERTPGKEAWNHPIYAFNSASTKRNEGRQVDVKLKARYSLPTNGEPDKAPRRSRVMWFHYTLDLDEAGNVVGGRYFGDSRRIDMLWAPLRPTQGGEEGNERGNPHVDVNEVLAIWRESVPEEYRADWINIDPTEEDRVLIEEAAEAEAAEVTEEATSSEPSAATEDANDAASDEATSEQAPSSEEGSSSDTDEAVEMG